MFELYGEMKERIDTLRRERDRKERATWSRPRDFEPHLAAVGDFVSDRRFLAVAGGVFVGDGGTCRMPDGSRWSYQNNRWTCVTR
jgi:hypothetical protein